MTSKILCKQTKVDYNQTHLLGVISLYTEIKGSCFLSYVTQFLTHVKTVILEELFLKKKKKNHISMLTVE